MTDHKTDGAKSLETKEGSGIDNIFRTEILPLRGQCLNKVNSGTAGYARLLLQNQELRACPPVGIRMQIATLKENATSDIQLEKTQEA
jgi:hypothetical protein